MGTRSCEATIQFILQWTTASRGELTVRNTGTLPITSWTVTFTVPNGLSYLQLGGYNLPGAPVTYTQNGLLPPGNSVTVPFAIGWSGGNVATPSPITCTAR